VDFARIEDDALSTHIQLRAAFKALKYVFRPDLAACLELVLADGAHLPKVDVVQILAYISKGPVPVNPEALRRALQRFMPDHAEEIMQGFGKQYYEEGEARGEARGKAQNLVRLLEKRIGPVSEVLRARIFAAETDCIDAWFDRAIEATEIESVFDRN
jgi:hypothetical protein